MTKLVNLLAATSFLLGVAVASSASAGISLNGVTPNGVHPNGVSPNGIDRTGHDLPGNDRSLRVVGIEMAK